MVISMKYVLYILLFFIVLYLCIPENNLDNIKTTFNDLENDYEYKFITINTPNLNTKNFYKYFDNTNNIMVIYPKINMLYKEKLGTIKFKCDRNCHIERLLNYYKDVLKNNNFMQDSINVDYYGVYIDKIVFYINNEELNNILKKCNICYID